MTLPMTTEQINAINGSEPLCTTCGETQHSSSRCTEPSTCSQSDFYELLAWPGLILYKHKHREEYVQVVDKSIAFVTGIAVSPRPDALYLHALQTPSDFLRIATTKAPWWPQNMSIKLLRNGVFGTMGKPGKLSGTTHGLRIDGGHFDGGYLTMPKGMLGTKLEQFRAIGFDNDASPAQVSSPWDPATFNYSQGLGGFAPEVLLGPNCRNRNYVGAVPGTAILVFYSSKLTGTGSVSRSRVQSCLRLFGCPDTHQVQLDGGGSVFLTVESEGALTRRVIPASRPVCHAIVICTP